jgi:gluconolactonase
MCVKKLTYLVCGCLLATVSLAQQQSPSQQSPSSQPAASQNNAPGNAQGPPPAPGATQGNGNAPAGGPRRAQPPREFALQALMPGFWKRLDKGAQLVTFATGFSFTEGPVWDPRNGGFLYVSDEEQNHIYKVTPDGAHTTVASTGDPDGSTYDEQGRLLDCASVLRAIVRVAPDGTLTTLVDHYDGKRFNSPNDIVMGPDGAYYFTDPTLDLPKGQTQETPYQGVYRLGRDGSITLLTKELDEPNGLAFSPDGKRLYVDDSKQRNIRVYAFHGGQISQGRIFGSEAPPEGQRGGVPDGMKIDKQGDLFVTGPNGIWVWDSAGHHLGTIALPRQAANLTWGDPDYKTLYLTAGNTVYKLRTKVRGFVPYEKAMK